MDDSQSRQPLAKTPQPESPSGAIEKQVATESRQIHQRSLGIAGFVFSLVGCGLCVSTLLAVSNMGASYEPVPVRTDAPVERQAVNKGVNAVGKGVTVLSQAIVFLVGGLVGGTLSMVGVVLCLVDVLPGPNRLNCLGLVVGLAGPALLGLKLLVVF